MHVSCSVGLFAAEFITESAHAAATAKDDTERGAAERGAKARNEEKKQKVRISDDRDGMRRRS
jgi:hypothetical protein